MKVLVVYKQYTRINYFPFVSNILFKNLLLYMYNYILNLKYIPRFNKYRKHIINILQQQDTATRTSESIYFMNDEKIIRLHI